MKKGYLYILMAHFLVLVVHSQSCYKEIRAGRVFTVGLQEDNTLWSWGVNANHELGDGTTSSRNYAVQIGTDTWSKFTVGDYHVLGIKSDGTLWSWGDNSVGQLGTGTSGSDVTIPTQIGTETNWAQITTGRQHSIGIKTDGTLWTWGFGDNSALGDGTTITKLTPTQIGTSNDWAKVYAGYYQTLAIKTNGTLWVWGSNLGGGGLGDGGVDDLLNPTQVGTDTNWVEIAAGNAHSVAIKSNGTMWSCGANFVGQLGTGDYSDAILFTQIGTDSDWVKIAVGIDHNLAIKSNGTLWSWGLNLDGQIGNGVIDATATNSVLSPIQIGTNTDWISVGTGSHSSFGITSTGLWAWGFDISGMLGDHLTDKEPFPVLIDCALLLSTDSNSITTTDVKAYPNPSSGMVQLADDALMNAKLDLYDIQGRLVHSATALSTIYNLDLSSFDQGTYVLKITTTDKTQTLKLIKK